MANDDKQTLTNADLRAAFMTGWWHEKGAITRGEAEAEAMRRWPDPLKWVKVGSGQEYAVHDGALVRRAETPPHNTDVIWTLADVRALASLLPREPVTITDAMVEKALDGFVSRASYKNGMRAALEAVAADLAAPAPTAQPPKPQWWAVVHEDEIRDFATAVEQCGLLNRNLTPCPWRVVALAEVPDVSDTEAQR
jgi:hypothetical protein